MADHIEKKTRKVFNGIHLGHLKNKDSFNRLSNFLATGMMKLPKDYFKGRVCADLGCGSSVHGIRNLLDMGAKYVYGMDLDGSFISPAEKILKGYNGWQLDVGSIEKLPYKDEQFDFVLCAGVIHHIKHDRIALKEAARVLKKGGKAFISVAGCGGILNRFYMEFLRNEYRHNKNFKKAIDNSSHKKVECQLDWLIRNMEDDGSAAHKKCVTLLECLKYLIDEDFLLSLKDRLQPPIYKMYSEPEFRGLLKEAGFKSCYRINKKPLYNNIRKIEVSLYINHNLALSKLLYGEGAFNLVVTK